VTRISHRTSSARRARLHADRADRRDVADHLLATIGLTAYQSSVRRGREAVLREDLYRMRDCIDQFYADKNKYPADLSELVSGNYMRRVLSIHHAIGRDLAGRAGEPDPTIPPQSRYLQRHEGSKAIALDGTKLSDGRRVGRTSARRS
jgi:general secretion pathway protein G